MNIVFMGTPDFAVPCLERILADGHHVSLVVTQADKPKGRGHELTPPPVKVCALQHGLEVFQPNRMKDDGVLEKLKAAKPDVMIVVAYGKILPEAVLKVAPLGCVNVHGSLLPMYRGAAPIQWAVLNGDTKTGVTTMLMDVGLDTGDTLLTSERTIPPEMTSGELYDLLREDGAELLSETLYRLKDGTVVPKPQPESTTAYASMLDKSMCPLDWTKSAAVLHNQVLGLNPWPVATCKCQNKLIKVFRSRVGDRCNASAGIVAKVEPFTVACGDGIGLVLEEIQAPNGKRMAIQDFLRGHPVAEGTQMD